MVVFFAVQDWGHCWLSQWVCGCHSGCVGVTVGVWVSQWVCGCHSGCVEGGKEKLLAGVLCVDGDRCVLVDVGPEASLCS